MKHIQFRSKGRKKYSVNALLFGVCNQLLCALSNDRNPFMILKPYAISILNIHCYLANKRPRQNGCLHSLEWIYSRNQYTDFNIVSREIELHCHYFQFIRLPVDWAMTAFIKMENFQFRCLKSNSVWKKKTY